MQTAVFFVPRTIVDEYGKVWECMGMYGKIPPCQRPRMRRTGGKDSPSQTFSKFLKSSQKFPRRHLQYSPRMRLQNL